MEEAKTVKHIHFEEMAAKFGFSSSLEFAEHVTSISKEERKALLAEFNRVSSKEKGKERGKSKPREKGKFSIEENDGMDANIDPEMSSSSGVGSSKRKRMLPGTASKTARSASKRAPAKRKPKRLEYVDQDSPNSSPGAVNKAEKESLASEELSRTFVHPAADTGLRGDCGQTKESSKESTLSAGSTCLDSGMGDKLLANQEVCRKKGGNKSLDKDQSQSLYMNIDGKSLVDRLFEDSQTTASLPRSVAANNNSRSTAAVTKSSTLALSSETCSPSVNIVQARVKLQSDKKSTLNTDLNIDELLFGF